MTAAWQHVDARAGFEVLFAEDRRFAGHVSAVEDGMAWAVRYDLELDENWVTRRARVWNATAHGTRERLLEHDGAGAWRVDGAPAPHLAGLLDVDLEASACTNAFPVRRLGLTVGAGAEAPAVYVRALDLAVERLEQHYARVPDVGETRVYDYVSPAFGFTARLVYAADGLVRDYPGIARRVL